MSQQKENDASGIGLLFAMLGWASIFLLAVAAFIVSIMAVIGTVLCLIAWNSKITLGGRVIRPDQARAFIYRGLIGAVALPLFIGFCCVLIGEKSLMAYWFNWALAGYAIGSAGVTFIDYLSEEEPQAETAGQLVMMPERQIPAPPPHTLSSQPAKPPFRFASWDDEDE